MPAKLDRCVKKLMADPKFKPRKEGQTKRSAAFAVCNAQLKNSSAVEMLAHLELVEVLKKANE